jgi:DNA replication protein DnaC
MYMNQIETQLMTLKLNGMLQCYKALKESRKLTELSLTDGMELLLDAESLSRDGRRFARLRQHASFRYTASIEEVRVGDARGLNQSLITELATCDYIRKGESVLITGATGCGKSFLASALGHQACAMGFKVAYFNMQKLFLKLKLARLEGSVHKLFDKLAKTPLLIIDDFGLTHLEKQQQVDFMELIEDRHAQNATIIISQLPIGSWYDVIVEETIADAILDRIIHTSHKIEIKGDSLRKKM